MNTLMKIFYSAYLPERFKEKARAGELTPEELELIEIILKLEKYER